MLKGTLTGQAVGVADAAQRQVVLHRASYYPLMCLCNQPVTVMQDELCCSDRQVQQFADRAVSLEVACRAS